MNQEQYALLNRSVSEWNAWRQRNPEVKIELSGANLCGADLQGADLSGADLREANLHGTNLYGANLYWANLSEANLREAYLCEANLYVTNLRGANLYWANLSEANLREANLFGAGLRGASLYAANLYGANLYAADLFEADLRETKYIWHCGPGGPCGDMLYAVMWDDGPHFFMGYFGGTEAKFLAAVEKQYGNSGYGRYYRAMVAAAKAWAEAYEMGNEC